jgi:hypothetical protein
MRISTEPQNGCCLPTRLRPRWDVTGGVPILTDPIRGMRGAPAAGDMGAGRMERTMSKAGDRPFDWVAGWALVSGAAVMVPSLAALAIALLAVAAALL